MPADKSLIQFFLEEAEEHLGILEQGFLRLEENPDDLTGIDELFRSAHTLKGSAALVKLHTISEVAHLMEDQLEAIRDGKLNPSKPLVDWLLNTLDAIKTAISDVVNNRPERESLLEEVQKALDEVLKSPASKKKPATETSAQVGPPPSKPIVEDFIEEKRSPGRRKEDIETLTQFVRVHMANIEKMMALVGELTILKNFFVSESQEASKIKDEIEYAQRRLMKEIEDFSSRYAYSLPEKIHYVDELLAEFQDLEFDRYEDINLFARKIQEITADISEGLKGIGEVVEDISAHVRRLERLALDLKELISEARMIEIGRLFQRFTRAVRDLASKEGKKVKLVVRGVETRIDRIIYDRLFDPILHLVRNSIAHGIESPEQRRKAGKPEEGRIFLSAKREGSFVLIEVRDDGRGINLKEVYNKAIEKGLLQKGQKVTKQQLINLLFMPGFSTALQTGEISGRGVGLDVVKEAINELNGTITVATAAGRGTAFRIRVPLTLVIVNVVKFLAGGIEFVVPSSLVSELAEINIQLLESDEDEILFRGRPTKLVDLTRAMGLYPERQETTAPALVVSPLPGLSMALVVDKILGQEDTVIRPLGKFLEGIKFYSGVSISADGKLMPVLNPATVVEMMEMAPERPLPAAGSTQEPFILVADDSLSVRRYLEEILQRRGYKVLSATNGLEALNLMYEKPISMVITDLEMPVMHGYELLREMKRRGLSEMIPAVVLTSRGTQKHMEKATALGAKDYLVKPVDEDALLDVVKKFTDQGINY